MPTELSSASSQLFSRISTSAVSRFKQAQAAGGLSDPDLVIGIDDKVAKQLLALIDPAPSVRVKALNAGRAAIHVHAGNISNIQGLEAGFP